MNFFQKIITGLMIPACALLLASCSGEGAAVASADEPAAQEAGLPDYGQRRDEVIALLEGIAAEGKTLSGQQVNEYEVFIECDSFDYIQELTGETPAVLGLELMFSLEYRGYRELLLEHAEEQAARGGLVTFTWHARNPIKVCPRGEYYECSQYSMSDEELARILTPGTRENELWLKDIDDTADILRDYADRGITVLFRPWHEMNGGWFWWGQKAQYVDLWNATYDRITNHHGITNIIWVWGADKQAEGAEQYYPGDDTVDFVGTDFYARSTDDAMFMTGYGNVQPLNGNGHFSITEVGIMPNYELFSAMKPLWFLQWGGQWLNADWIYKNCDVCSEKSHVQDVYQWQEVLSVAEMPATERMSQMLDPADRTAPYTKECPLSLL